MLSEHNPELLRQIQIDELVPAISRWTKLGGVVLIGTCGLAVLLAAIIKYPITVRSPATVRPAGEQRIIEASGQGIVKSILVKENQTVAKGEAIAIIDDSQLLTKKSQILDSIRQNQLQISQINAQLQALQTQIAAEANSIQREIASTKADLSRNQREYQDKQNITQAEVEEAKATLEFAKEELKRYKQLGNTGAIATLQIKEKEQTFKAAIAKLQRAKTGLNPSIAAVTMVQERMSQEKAKGESTLAALNKERETLIQGQIAIQNKINLDQQEITQINRDLRKTIIRTLEAGTVLKLDIRNPGQVVQPGQAIAQISPNQAPLVVKARVDAADISKVKLCKTVQVAECSEGKVIMRISAYPYPDYGTINGAVRGITADAITPQTNSNIGVSPYYEVTIQPDRFHLTKANQSYAIQPGMEVTADIISQQETVLTFILRKARLLTNL
ncbi:secretion protein HlyD [Calothrix sp. NIES-2100]|uniref:HlyD family secretion protein n=1 Tax=Calothrix sp. NIES-2100 TaxID=1954172 RepID=UPI000B5FE72B|nr:secretion protein HlyD [Calothrix sp. NIES-2100]